jgi:hypothetical protein
MLATPPQNEKKKNNIFFFQFQTRDCSNRLKIFTKKDLSLSQTSRFISKFLTTAMLKLCYAYIALSPMFFVWLYDC